MPCKGPLFQLSQVLWRQRSGRSLGRFDAPPKNRELLPEGEVLQDRGGSGENNRAKNERKNPRQRNQFDDRRGRQINLQELIHDKIQKRIAATIGRPARGDHILTVELNEARFLTSVLGPGPAS